MKEYVIFQENSFEVEFKKTATSHIVCKLSLRKDDFYLGIGSTKYEALKNSIRQYRLYSLIINIR